MSELLLAIDQLRQRVQDLETQNERLRNDYHGMERDWTLAQEKLAEFEARDHNAFAREAVERNMREATMSTQRLREAVLKAVRETR